MPVKLPAVTSEPKPRVIVAQTAALIRDVPRSCRCGWEWVPRENAYQLIALKPGCPWHTGR